MQPGDWIRQNANFLWDWYWLSIQKSFLQKYENEKNSLYESTFIAKEDIRKIWHKKDDKSVGEEGNETSVHSSSKADKVEWIYFRIQHKKL